MSWGHHKASTEAGFEGNGSMEEHKKSQKRRLQVGLSKEVKVPRGESPHPSNGGSRGYDQEWRRAQIIQADQEPPTTASSRSISRWRTRLEPYHMSGNKAQPKIRGLDLFHLIMYRMVYPKANADEVRRFIFENNPTNPVVFSRMDITRCEQLLDMRRLRSATTANQALLPHNVLRRHLFWTSPPPVGIRLVPRVCLLDYDECGIFMTTCNRVYGKGYVGSRIRESGPYGYDEKWTLMMAIRPCGFRHVWFRKICGTNAQDMLLFWQAVINRLQGCGIQVHFMFDNLSSHFSAAIFDAIYQAGHRIVPRPA